MKLKSIAAVLFLICYLSSCDSMYDLPFDKVAWIEDGSEGNYPEKRGQMLNDLLQNHSLKGKTYREILNLLGLDYGEIENQQDSNLVIQVSCRPNYRMDIFRLPIA